MTPKTCACGWKLPIELDIRATLVEINPKQNKALMVQVVFDCPNCQRHHFTYGPVDITLKVES
mgnify:FL=1|jgi:hypothetical protein